MTTRVPSGCWLKWRWLQMRWYPRRKDEQTARGRCPRRRLPHPGDSAIATQVSVLAVNRVQCARPIDWGWPLPVAECSWPRRLLPGLTEVRVVPVATRNRRQPRWRPQCPNQRSKPLRVFSAPGAWPQIRFAPLRVQRFRVAVRCGEQWAEKRWGDRSSDSRWLKPVLHRPSQCARPSPGGVRSDRCFPEARRLV